METGALKHRAVLRLGVAYTLAMLIAYMGERTLGFLLPVLTTVMLSLPLPRPTLQQNFRNMLHTLAGFSAGATLAILFMPGPAIYTLLLGLGLFYSYYVFNRGASLWLVLMLLMSLLLMPMLMLMHQQLALGVLFEFVVFAWIAVWLVFFAHLLWPDPETAPPPTRQALREYSPQTALAAARSTAVVLPLALLFISLQWTGQILVLVFAALFTLTADQKMGWKAARNSLVSTLLGGMAAYLFYALLVAVPQFYFFILLHLLTVLLFAHQIFSGSRLAPYMASALTTLVLLVNASLGEGTDFTRTFMNRFGLIVLAAFYVVFALGFLDRLARHRKRSQRVSGISMSA